ncbi:unnamed protein product [Coccothraustes coccothraustes]
MKWFLCAQSIGQVAVRSRGRLLPKDALNRSLATGSCLPPSSASPVVGNIAKSFSAASEGALGIPVPCGFVLRLLQATALSAIRRRRSGFFAHRALRREQCAREGGFCRKTP